MENTVQKYAVYSVDNGKETLKVVVDTNEQAQSEKENFKDADKVIVKKAEVKNFGKDGEEIVKSEIVEENNQTEKLSDYSKNDEDENNSDDDEQLNNDATENNNEIIDENLTQPVEQPIQTKENDFWTDYIGNGDLMLGMGYGFGVEESTPEVEEQKNEEVKE